ncbi:hypothetical protein ACIQZO_34320 [Streptomyces sp. NPDC097617]|uniref:hypothetical protein n=1 Tax=Streptomyces sp. NPDC097617 TaxID=3366091 RepID=UPI00380C2BB9
MPDETPTYDAVPDPAQEAFDLCGRLVGSGRYEEALAAADEAALLLRGRPGGPGGPGAAALLAYVLVLRCEALSKPARWEECLRTASEAAIDLAGALAAATESVVLLRELAASWRPAPWRTGCGR